jgi:hypothetical protein
MIAIVSGATALLAGLAAGAFWAARIQHRGARHAEPCRRCGARN